MLGLSRRRAIEARGVGVVRRRPGDDRRSVKAPHAQVSTEILHELKTCDVEAREFLEREWTPARLSFRLPTGGAGGR